MAELMGMGVFLLLQVTAVIGRYVDKFVVSAGGEVTLPCADGQQRCDATSWILSISGSDQSRLLVSHGRINYHNEPKSDRLTVTRECSLVVKEVTAEDVGRYTCRQELQPGSDAHVYLSVVHMYKHQDSGRATLNCSVVPYDWCQTAVELLYQGGGVGPDIETSQSECSAAAIVPSSSLDLFACKVTDDVTGDVLHFLFSPQLSGENTTPAATSTTTAGRRTYDTSTTQGHDSSGLLRTITVCVGLAALIVTVVVVTVWIRTKERKTRTDDDNASGEAAEGVMTYENVGEPAVRFHSAPAH